LAAVDLAAGFDLAASVADFVSAADDFAADVFFLAAAGFDFTGDFDFMTAVSAFVSAAGDLAAGFDGAFVVRFAPVAPAVFFVSLSSAASDA
jgi:hypothetical protein